MDHHPRNHEKKNNIKTLQFGIGGIVLFAGALVTATVVSALAFKTRSQRRSSSEKMDSKSPSNKLELTPDDKHDYVHFEDSNEGEDQENTLIGGCSAFQSEELDNEEQNQLMLIDNENDEHVDANSLVSEEGVTSIQEHEEIEVLLKNIVSGASQDEDENEDEDRHERVFMNGTSTMEADCVNLVKAEDDLHVEFLEELMADHEVASDAQQMQANQVCETSIDNHSTAEEDSSPGRLMNKEEKGKEMAQKVEEQVTIQDELFNGDETEGVMSIREIEAIKVPLKDIVSEASEGEDHQESVFMNEAAMMEAVSVNQVKANDNLQVHILEELMADPEVRETFVDDQSTAKEESSASRLMNYEEKDEEVAQKVGQVTIKDDLFNEDKKGQSTEATRVDEMVKKDEITHVESIKQAVENNEDVAVKDEISSYELEDSSKNEELAPKAKISKYETLENKGKHEFSSEPWILKLMIWCVMISVWCLCHWYSEQPFLEVTLVGSLLFILVLLGYETGATYLVNRKIKHH